MSEKTPVNSLLHIFKTCPEIPSRQAALQMSTSSIKNHFHLLYSVGKTDVMRREGVSRREIFV